VSVVVKYNCPLNELPPRNKIVSPLKLLEFTLAIVFQAVLVEVPDLASFPKGLT
jgi:hypothetical protein